MKKKKKKSPVNPNDHPPRDEHGKSAEPYTHRHVHFETGAKINVADELEEQHKTERNETHTTQKRQLMWTVIGSILVFIYTGIMAIQAWQTKRL